MEYTLEVKNLEYNIKRQEIENEYEFSRDAEYYVREIDIIKIKVNNKMILKISYINKCYGNKKGFYITEHDENNKILNERIFDMYFSNDNTIKIIIRKNFLRIITPSESAETNILSSIDNSTIELNSDVSDEKNKIILNINNEEYESEIKYTYIGRKEIFKDEEVESYYNYCCNGQGD
jgi:hypothetical protein